MTKIRYILGTCLTTRFEVRKRKLNFHLTKCYEKEMDLKGKISSCQIILVHDFIFIKLHDTAKFVFEIDV